MEEVFCLESAHPQMGLGCRFRRAVVTAIMNLFLFFWSKWLSGRSCRAEALRSHIPQPQEMPDRGEINLLMS